MKCQAKDPSKCRYHGHPESLTSFIPIPVLPRAAELGARVFTQGTKPTDIPIWWDTYYPLQTNNLPKPVILDVIPSPLGDLVVIWEEQILSAKHISDLNEKGLTSSACRYRRLADGKSVGALVLKHQGETDISVNASDVSETLRGRGYGSALYLYAAKQLGTTGRRLTRGTIQSPDAMDLWNNLLKHYPKFVPTTVRPGTVSRPPRITEMFLDLRSLT